MHSADVVFGVSRHAPYCVPLIDILLMFRSDMSGNLIISIWFGVFLLQVEPERTTIALNMANGPRYRPSLYNDILYVYI